MHIYAVYLDRFGWNLVEEVATSCRLEVVSFMKIGAVKAVLYLGNKWNFSVFSSFSCNLATIRYIIYPKKTILWRRVPRKSVRESHALRRGFNEFYSRTFRIYFSTRVKSSIRDLHIILFSILEFRRPWLLEDRALLIGANNMKFTRVPWSHVILCKWRTC
jgi:hypothetical protein